MNRVCNISDRFITYAAWSGCALMVAIAGASLGSTAASAATSPKVAQLAVAGSGTIQVKLESGSGKNGKKWDKGQAHLVVINTGEAATVLSSRAFLDAPVDTCATKQAKLTQPSNPDGP